MAWLGFTYISIHTVCNVLRIHLGSGSCTRLAKFTSLVLWSEKITMGKIVLPYWGKNCFSQQNVTSFLENTFYYACWRKWIQNRKAFHPGSAPDHMWGLADGGSRESVISSKMTLFSSNWAKLNIRWRLWCYWRNCGLLKPNPSLLFPQYLPRVGTNGSHFIEPMSCNKWTENSLYNVLETNWS